MSRTVRTQHHFISGAGGQLTVHSAVPFGVDLYGCSVRYVASGYIRGFQVGLPGYHAGAELGLLKNPRRLGRLMTAHQKELRVSEAGDASATIATLISNYHEVQTVFGGPAPALTTILALFNNCQFSDSPDGMSVVPSGDALAAAAQETFVISSPDIGVLTISRQHASNAVQSRGRKTSSGARISKLGIPSSAVDVGTATSAARKETYRLSYPDAEVDLSPTTTGISDFKLTEWVDELSVSWS